MHTAQGDLVQLTVSGSLDSIARSLREQNVPGPYHVRMSRAAFTRLLDELGGFMVVDRIGNDGVRYGEFLIEVWDA